MAARPRVLLVDDDPSVRLLVEMAFEDMAIELVSCADVAQALAALAAAPARLVLCDLMMPGVSGLQLLERLAAEPALARGARRVAFSAGLDAAMRSRLQALGVWRQLLKPASVQSLRACVADALGSEGSAVSAAPSADERSLIAQHFAGDAALFHAYRESCRAQFAADVADGARALFANDPAALRRLGHSLKTVLRSLGEDAAAQQAVELEQAAAAADRAAMQRAWPPLAATLRALSREVKT